MLKPAELKQKAEHCRELLRAATAPEVREQLRIWVREFEEQAGASNLARALRVLTNSPS